MGFSAENGYVPSTVEDILDAMRVNVNTQFGTSYTAETFVGTNFYKYFYALAQRVQENEIKTSEIFLKLQDYFDVTNEEISRPVVTAPGVIEKLADEGYVASVKAPIDADAGKIYICVDTDGDADDYDDVKDAINLIISQCVAAGVVTQGSETTAIVLSNGQSFTFKFALPDSVDVLLRLTTNLSDNNQFVVKSPEEVKAALIANIAAKYSLGKNFEPQKYFSTVDAPWAESVLLEWSNDAGANYHSTVFTAAYDDLFNVLLENITLVEA